MFNHSIFKIYFLKNIIKKGETGKNNVNTEFIKKFPFLHNLSSEDVQQFKQITSNLNLTKGELEIERQKWAEKQNADIMVIVIFFVELSQFTVFCIILNYLKMIKLKHNSSLFKVECPRLKCLRLENLRPRKTPKKLGPISVAL